MVAVARIVVRDVDLAHGFAECGAEFASEPDHGHGVDAVRGHLDVKNVVFEAVQRHDVSPRRDVRIELENSVLEPPLFQADLVGGDQHPLGFDSAHGPRRDVEADQLRTDRRDRNDLVGGDIGRRGSDRQRVARAYVDDAHQEPVGIGMLLDAHQPAGDDAGEFRAALDVFNRKAQQGEALRELVARRFQFDVVAQPRDRQLHASCSNTRGSFSKSTRISSMSWRTIAMRSMPTPNAQPETSSGS